MSPDGDGIVFYDTMSRAKRPFEPIEPGKVGMYVCGPTVYGDPHIGNFRTFIVGDIIRRWLEYRGYDVFMIINLTDIDDKTIRDSGKEGVSLKEFTDRYIGSFFRGVDLLSLRRSTTYPRATEYIPQMIEFIEALLEKGVAYVAEDGVYFDVDKFPAYGKLSGIDVTKLKTTERMAKDEYKKEAVHDFALWKASTPEEIKRGIYYESPWGKGRPGWHIECSVMIRSLLGDTVDIHVGGEDLVFPHHENEIAQSESLTGKQFVRYWMHVRHLMVNGGSMSKSLGNYVSFDEVVSKFGVEAYRYFLLSVHYRRPLDYTEATIEIARNSAARLENTLDLVETTFRGPDTNLDYGEEEKKLLEEVRRHVDEFKSAMDNDLDSHAALDSLHALSGAINGYIAARCDVEPAIGANKGVLLKAYVLYRSLLDVLGLFERRKGGEDELAAGLIKAMIDLRNRLRAEKKYALSDEVRETLSGLGVVLSDTGGKTTWKLKKS
jgi:cysteinyl-tRNA synthetase